MPWVLEETFAAGGLDLAAERRAAPARAALPDPLGRRGPAPRLRPEPERLRDEVARFSRATPPQVERFLDGAAADLRARAILGAGRRDFRRAADLARFAPRMVRLGAALPLHRLVARHFEHPRVREAFSFHSLFIGGDPFRVPAIYGALV